MKRKNREAWEQVRLDTFVIITKQAMYSIILQQKYHAYYHDVFAEIIIVKPLVGT